MYTFHPIPSVPVDHAGFYIVLFIVVLSIVNSFNNNGLDDIRAWIFSIFMLAVGGFAYGVSYHWTDQEPQVFKNEPVVAEFVGYVAEGYNESRTRGKSTQRVDVHMIYVVYRVNGNDVLMEGRTGVEYPKWATLYKN